MKKVLLFSLYLLFSGASLQAQSFTTINEDFNSSCITTTGFVHYWSTFNPSSTPSANGEWQCAPGQGRGETNGVSCTSFIGGNSHLDTSYFITPLLDLSGYSKVYLRFDDKVSVAHSGGRLAIGRVDSDFVARGGTPINDSDLTDSVAPLITNTGVSSDWMRHQIDLTPYKNIVPFSLAFRYTGTTTSQSTWYLDNINIDTASLVEVQHISKTEMPLKVIGACTTSEITISYTANAAGSYNLTLYDMMGREVHNEQLNTNAGTYTYKLGNLNLLPGIYLVKMGNGLGYGTVSVVVR